MTKSANQVSADPVPESSPGDQRPQNSSNCRKIPLSVWGLLILFAILLSTQWRNAFSVAQADGIAYITGGVNLITTGAFINPLGELETWFPPLYPVLIGLFSLGGRIDPVAVGRLICAAFSLWGLVLVWQATCIGTGGKRLAAVLAAVILAGNFLYQTYAMAVMSHAPATALGLAAFVLWLKASENATARLLILIGLCVGAAFLVRPEAVLVLPLWLLIDAGSWGWRIALRRAIFSSAASAIMILPYVIYLHHVTGKWQLSGKGDVTLAIGRGSFYGTPRDYIDPETLEWKYYQHDVTALSELKRVGFNLSRVGDYLLDTLRGPFGGGLILLSLAGTWRLAKEKRWRFLLGLIAQLGFILAVLATWCGERMLHTAWPVFAMLVGVGGDYLWRVLKESETKRAVKGVAILCLAWAGLGWLESATRQPRWSLGSDSSSVLFLREAGLAFRDQQTKLEQPKGAMMELGATVGYYAGAYRRLMPGSNDLDTIVRYLQKRDGPHRPVWLALWSRNAKSYHPSIREPFVNDEMPLPKVFEYGKGKDRLAIYEIPPAPEANDLMKEMEPTSE